MKVLVTDGHLKAALSAVRHLGRLGAEVHTTKDRPGHTLCSTSTFNHSTHFLPKPEQAPAFDAALAELLARERFDYLFPTSDATLQRISLNRRRIAELVRLDLPPQPALGLVFSKIGLLQTAEALDLPVPKTVVWRHGEDTGYIFRALPFPIVAKVFPGETYDRLRYLNNVAALNSFLSETDPRATILLQEYIQGSGYGFFGFFEHGKPLLYQMHERLWEYPCTGGPSVFARTIQDPMLQELGTRLLAHLNWQGLAMVEFKKADRDGKYTLMEINPRLWGSLDLSIAAGADFLSLALATDRVSAARTLAVRPTSFLWVLPDSLLYLLSRPSQVFHFVKLLLSRDIRKNFDLDDARPLLRQLRESFYWIRTLLPKGRLRYPHGRPARVHNAVAPQADASSRTDVRAKDRDSKTVATAPVGMPRCHHDRKGSQPAAALGRSRR